MALRLGAWLPRRYFIVGISTILATLGHWMAACDPSAMIPTYLLSILLMYTQFTSQIKHAVSHMQHSCFLNSSVAANMDATDRPQIVEHVHKSVPYVVYDTRWVPSSARMVVLGCHPRGTGALQVFSMTRADLKLEHEVPTHVRWPALGWREARRQLRT